MRFKLHISSFLIGCLVGGAGIGIAIEFVTALMHGAAQVTHQVIH